VYLPCDRRSQSRRAPAPPCSCHCATNRDAVRDLASHKEVSATRWCLWWVRRFTLFFVLSAVPLSVRSEARERHWTAVNRQLRLPPSISQYRSEIRAIGPMPAGLCTTWAAGTQLAHGNTGRDRRAHRGNGEGNPAFLRAGTEERSCLDCRTSGSLGGSPLSSS
jgi:hypothetical protein